MKIIRAIYKDPEPYDWERSSVELTLEDGRTAYTNLANDILQKFVDDGGVIRDYEEEGFNNALIVSEIYWEENADLNDPNLEEEVSWGHIETGVHDAVANGKKAYQAVKAHAKNYVRQNTDPKGPPPWANGGGAPIYDPETGLVIPGKAKPTRKPKKEHPHGGPPGQQP